MSKKKKHKKINIGLVIASVGIGVIITVIIPVWGWIIAVGGMLIFLGWYIMENNN